MSSYTAINISDLDAAIEPACENRLDVVIGEVPKKQHVQKMSTQDGPDGMWEPGKHGPDIYTLWWL